MKKTMKNKIKNRIGMIGVLLVAGFVLAVIGNALGAGELIQGTPKLFETDIAKVVVTENQVIVYKDGKVVQNFTLPKEQTEFVIENSTTAKEICAQEHGGNSSACDKEIEEYKNASETVIEFIKAQISDERMATREEKILAIINESSRVREIIEGKKYEMAGIGQNTGPENTILTQRINVGEKRYLIEINMSREVTEKLGMLPPSLEPGGETLGAMSKANEYEDKVLLEMAMKDPRVQELLEGKEYEKDYEISGRGVDVRDERFGEIQIRGLIVDGKHYEITIAVNSEKVISIYETDKLREMLFGIAGNDIRVHEIMNGKKFKDEDEFKKIMEHKEENNFTSERDYFWKYPGRHVGGAVTDKAQLWYEFEDGSSYRIVIDMNTETVTSVEETRPAYEEIIKLRVE
ncbi:hypothetical protein BEH94_04615 [Candidatus Altiarchaeales archaeon WOR_SM1_SCG]|nr:hypothetical protein BEH94_04615 [Candidatus Altiarchaeales archaeon WOR_SM1_SCG]